jgi:hypothetical protein
MADLVPRLRTDFFTVQLCGKQTDGYCWRIPAGHRLARTWARWDGRRKDIPAVPDQSDEFANNLHCYSRAHTDPYEPFGLVVDGMLVVVHQCDTMAEQEELDVAVIPLGSVLDFDASRGRRKDAGSTAHAPLTRRAIAAGVAASLLAPFGLVVADAEPVLEPLHDDFLDAPALELPASISMQPEPVDWMVVNAGRGHAEFTAIYREWNPGDEHHCRLCPLERCMARKYRRHSCIVGVPELIPDDEIKTFDLGEWMRRHDLS